MIEIHFKNIQLKNNYQVEFSRDVVEFLVKGHSGIGQKGTDIACASVSAIVQTSVLSINKIAMIHQKVEQKSGYLSSFI